MSRTPWRMQSPSRDRTWRGPGYGCGTCWTERLYCRARTATYQTGYFGVHIQMEGIWVKVGEEGRAAHPNSQNESDADVT
mmetsp:Transcript_7419/g.13105  ORF Transcript_7419/g.13105 Transcript_7419/m.13105 type:complete len:80 (-) Transcript_7419:569-808(-)